MSNGPADDAALDYDRKRQREQRRWFARRPQAIGGVLARLITSRGYDRVQTDGQLQATWRLAVGEQLAAQSRASRVYRGKLEIVVANSIARQELEFARRQILNTLASQLPDLRIRDLRFRVGPL